MRVVLRFEARRSVLWIRLPMPYHILRGLRCREVDRLIDADWSSHGSGFGRFIQSPSLTRGLFRAHISFPRRQISLTTVLALVAVTAQATSERNSAYRRFQAAQSTPEGVKAAEDWLQIEQQSPNAKNLPPHPYGRQVLRSSECAHERNPRAA
jgi:hypothetical protein